MTKRHPRETTMLKYFSRRSALLSSVALAISLAGGIADAKDVDYNTSKPRTVVELGVPANATSPIRILAGVRP